MMQKRKIGWKRLVAVLAAFALLQSVIVVFAGYVPDPEIYQIDDPAGWKGPDSMMEVVGRTMTLTFDNSKAANTKASVIYDKQAIGDELVEFTGNFIVQSGGWDAIVLRSDLPGHYVWDMHEYYAFMIRPGEIQLTRYHADDKGKEGTVATAAIDLQDGEDHLIRVGAQNYGGKTYVRLYADGALVIEYEDDVPLSIDVAVLNLVAYGHGSTIAVTTVGENGFWENNPVEAAQPDVTWTAMKRPDDWFVNQYQGGMTLGSIYDCHLTVADGKATLTGVGSISTLTQLEARTFSFVGSVSATKDADTAYADFLFVKSSRTAIGGSGGGYALRVRPNGRIQLVRYLNGSAQVFPAFDTGLDMTAEHKFTVAVEKTGVLQSEIRIWIDGATAAYRYQDNKYGPALEADGFFGVYNNHYNVVSTIRDLSFVGVERYVSDSEPTEQVLWADYLVEQDGRKLIHWVYNTGYAMYRGVQISTVSGEVLGSVDYPDNVFVLPDDHTYTQLFVTALRADGKQAERQLIDLTVDRTKYYTDRQERVSVCPADDEHPYAGFVTESGKEFTIKGFNYIELRHGDHSTLEPAIDGVNSADYDPLQAETTFKYMAMNGYNTVRIFVVTGVRRQGNCGLTGPYDDTNGLYIPYMENYIDFLRRAQKYGIYVIPNFCENEMISSAYYRKMSGGASHQSLLFKEDGMKAKADYVKLFVKYVQERDPDLMPAVLAIEAQNEFAFYNTSAPFTQTSGTYTYFDGTTYDMGSDQERHALAKHAAVTYYQAIRDAIDEVDDKVMLCEGTFPLGAVGKTATDPKALGVHPDCDSTDNRFPLSAEDYLDTAIDFLDVHIYCNSPKEYADALSPAEAMKSQEDSMLLNSAYCREQRKQKPVVLGEFGCNSANYDDENYAMAIELSATAMKNGYAGSLYWTLGQLVGNTGENDGRCFDTLLENMKKFYVYEN